MVRNGKISINIDLTQSFSSSISSMFWTIKSLLLLLLLLLEWSTPTC